MEIYTIGFTKKTAAEFFESLKRNGIERLVDVRVNNTSQLAAFAKRDDLTYFLDELAGADYVHEPMLAPTRDMLKAYRDREIDWDAYELAFIDLLAERGVENVIPRELFSERTVLLCSEPTPDLCHRRLVVEYLNRAWGDVKAIDL
jgi:uncharacterized protein (DUF488 family)